MVSLGYAKPQKMLLLLILLVNSPLIFATDGQDMTLAFVFEGVRHGARAPIYANDPQFTVPPGMLTP